MQPDGASEPDLTKSNKGKGRQPQPAGLAAIVLCGDDPVALGAAAAGLRQRGRHVAVWLGEPDPQAIIEMVDELFAPKLVEGLK